MKMLLYEAFLEWFFWTTFVSTHGRSVVCWSKIMPAVLKFTH